MVNTKSRNFKDLIVQGMRRIIPIVNQSPKKAARVVGIAFVTSMVIVTWIDDFLLPNFVIPGDTETLANDIEADAKLFHMAVVGYLFVLALDSIIGLALYVVLKPGGVGIALLTGLLRLLYASILVLGLFALVFHVIDVYGYANLKLLGYAFFAVHILVLGYAVFKSGYIPKSLGILLILASFAYTIFFVDTELPQTLLMGLMLLMAIAELSLSLWLWTKRNQLP